MRRGNRLRIIVGGFLGLLPAGGITWDYIQYILGFAELGHDVFYLEDTRLWPVYQQEMSCQANVEHLQRVMAAFGMDDRWAYRDEITGRCFGMTINELKDICKTADVFVNVSCSTVMREEYQAIPARILVDSDPMFTQMQYETQEGFTPGTSGMRTLVGTHTHHFTFGENVGLPGCRIPNTGVAWRPTRQPVSMAQWPITLLPRPPAAFTTVMNWNAVEPVQYAGETWGQKSVEFMQVMTLPARVSVPLAVAVGQTTGTPFPGDAARAAGWRVLEADAHVRDWNDYRTFIQNSLGECSVAKETYVKANTGWFSCRSACYLATGRPVVTQDTGWTQHIPSGRGVIAFSTLDQAVAGLENVLTDPAGHAKAAREIATEYFDGRRVLTRMLNEVR